MKRWKSLELVEWPNILMGSIDEEFLEGTVRSSYFCYAWPPKIFSLETLDGSLAPYFITVSNMPSDSTRDATIMAFESVRARLSDASFFGIKT